MSIEMWLAFAAATMLLLLIPGPTVALVVSYGLGQGRRAAPPMAFGVALGHFTAMTLSILGVGALLAASPAAFTVLQVLGVGYLVWLGVTRWRATPELTSDPKAANASVTRMLTHAWLVTALNPKSIIFFVAFLPQFFNPQGDLLTQFVVLQATFIGLAFINALGYASLASGARQLATDTITMRRLNRVGGVLLICVGLATAAAVNRPDAASASPVAAQSSIGSVQARWMFERFAHDLGSTHLAGLAWRP